MTKREGVNEDIENWSVSQVLSWLKSTNDGQFEEFVATFKQHQIYGDALLSLTNDILRDELGIVAYGARHALLKAIQSLKQSNEHRRELQSKLEKIKFNIDRSGSYKIRKKQSLQSGNSMRRHVHRKASMSSLCSKSSIKTKTSYTYCKGDTVKDNADTIDGIDSNWENLNTMAKHGVVDASEYLKQAKLIVRAVTGTTIKLTRKGSAEDAGTDLLKSGFFEFEENIPIWSGIESQSAIKYEWNPHTLRWDKSYLVVKIAENPFSRGSLRVSYYCLDLTENVTQRDAARQLTVNLNVVGGTARSVLVSPTDSIGARSSNQNDNGPLKRGRLSSLKGLHPQSGPLPRDQNRMNSLKLNFTKNDKDAMSPMSVPAEFVCGRSRGGTGTESDHLPFPFLSPSVAEMEDEDGDHDDIDDAMNSNAINRSFETPPGAEDEDRKSLKSIKSLKSLKSLKSMKSENVKVTPSPEHPKIVVMGDQTNSVPDIPIPVDGEQIEATASIPSNTANTETTNHEHTANNTIVSTKTTLQKGDLVARLLGFEHRYGGTLLVAKKSIDLTESVQTYFNDARTQSVSQLFANEYNKYNPPKKVAFIKASVIQLLETNSEQFFCVEDYLHGAYMKHLDNYGGDEGIRNTPSAFAHFTYEASQHRLLVVDIQGVGDLYTDPQIHTCDGKGFGKGNLGIDGMIKFLNTHQCNAICQHLRLDIVNPKPIVYGTRPAKMYMDKQHVKVIENVDQLNNEEYHRMPTIPMSTLSDYYLKEIYRLDREQRTRKRKRIEENGEELRDGVEGRDITANGKVKGNGNAVNVAKQGGMGQGATTGRSGGSRMSSEDLQASVTRSESIYNPLTPLIQKGPDYGDMEETSCGWCRCLVL